MAKYVFAYHGGGGADMVASVSQEEMAAEMAKWEAWYGELGDAVLDGGNPIGQTKVVTADGVLGPNDSPLTDYTIVEAGDLDAAVAAAKGCPILAHGGSVEVAEAIEMG